LLEGLGGKTTISCVCGPTDDGDKGCNHQLGRQIDQPLLRETPFAIHRLFGPGDLSDKVLFLERPDFGGYLDSVGTTLAVQVFHTNGWKIVGNELPAFIVEKLENLPTKIRRTISPLKEFAPARLIIRRRDLLLRAMTNELADAFEAKLRAETSTVVGLLTQSPTPRTPRSPPATFFVNGATPTHLHGVQRRWLST